MRVKGQARRDRDAKVVEMLAAGHAVGHIAEFTGSSLPTVYRRRAAWLKETGNAAVAKVNVTVDGDAPEVGDAPVVAMPAVPTQLADLALSVGLRRHEIDRLIEAGNDALLGAGSSLWREWLLRSRINGMNGYPQRELAEAQVMESKKIDYEDFKEWLAKFVNHLARTLSEDDFMDLAGWLEEMTKLDHPKML